MLEELQSAIWVYDVESYPNWFCCGFREVNTGDMVQFEIGPGVDDGELLRQWWATLDGIVFGFNNFGYDDHILKFVLDGHDDPTLINGLSKAIIEGELERRFSPFREGEGVMVADLRAIVGEAAGSLKEIGIKLDHPRLQELPYDPTLPLDAEQIANLLVYNANDLAITELLLGTLEAAVQARVSLTLKYGVNVISKRDAQIGEAILKSEYERTYPDDTTWRTTSGNLLSRKIQFIDDKLCDLHGRMAKWPLDYKIEIEAAETKREEERRMKGESFSDQVVYAGCTFSVGLGGLHSDDEPGIFTSDEETELLDIDVASYYPALIRSFGLCPIHLSPTKFKPVFDKLLNERLRAKRAGETVLADGLKIAINSIFGKFISPWSWLCDPLTGATITLNGQLILLMTVEYLSLIPGVSILSANTDGLLVRAPRDCPLVKNVTDEIGEMFGLSFEFKQVEKYVRRDINNFIMLYAGSEKPKRKGCYHYDTANVQKKATKRIVIDAVEAHFLHGIPVEQTIRAETDICAFADYFKASPGWSCETEDGQPLGRINRWYESTNGQMLWKVKGTDRVKFAGVGRAVVINDLPSSLPSDLDYDHYILAAEALIAPIEHPELRRMSTLDFKDLSEDQKTRLSVARNTTAFDLTLCLGIDLTRLREAYLAKVKGNAYDTMKSLAVRLWVSQGGKLNKGDLAYLLNDLDASEGYFTKRRKRDLQKIIDWVARDIVPYTNESIEDSAANAILWAAREVKPLPEPAQLYHKTLFDSSLVRGAWLNEMVTGALNPRRFAAKIAARARHHDFPLSGERLVGILTAAQSLNQTFTPKE